MLCVIHDNGSYPFVVEVDYVNSIATVYCVEREDFCDNYTLDAIPPAAVVHKIFIFTKAFIGTGPDLRSSAYADEQAPRGNTLLFEVPSGRLTCYKYIYVSGQIYSFTVPIDDQIIEYESPLGNNDVPYPVAIGRQLTYFMVERRVLLTDDVKAWVAALDEYDGDKYTYLYNSYRGYSNKDPTLPVAPSFAVTKLTD